MICFENGHLFGRASEFLPLAFPQDPPHLLQWPLPIFLSRAAARLGGHGGSHLGLCALNASTPGGVLGARGFPSESVRKVAAYSSHLRASFVFLSSSWPGAW